MSTALTRPPITVITVVRNGESVIDGCVQSVLEQQITDIEYIIIDGASSDKTLDILRSYGRSISLVVSESDKGLYDAMNKGLRLANGRFIHFLNADDRYVDRDTLCTLLPQLDENFVCHAQMHYVMSGGEQITLGEKFVRSRELKGSRIPQPALFVAKSIYDQVGEFDIDYRIAADYEMVLRLTAKFPTKFIAQPTTIMHTGGISFRKPGLAFKESMAVARRHGRSRIGSWCDFAEKHVKWQIAQRIPSSVFVRLRRVKQLLKAQLTSALNDDHK